jgi:hypothetical protein
MIAGGLFLFLSGIKMLMAGGVLNIIVLKKN